MINNKIEEIQKGFGLTKEDVRRVQASFASNLTGRYETTGSLNGQPVTMYFRADGKNTRGNIIHVYNGKEEYTDTEWIATSKNLGFDNNCLDREYIEDVVLNTDEEIINNRLKAMSDSLNENRVLNKNEMKEYYNNLLLSAKEISKNRADERQ